MATPKLLKPISENKAETIIRRNLKNGTGDWEGAPMYTDFVYQTSNGTWMIRPTLSDFVARKWTFERGKVSL